MSVYVYGAGRFDYVPFDVVEGVDAQIADVVDLKNKPEMGAGLFRMKSSQFVWEYTYDEVVYVVSGAIKLTCEAESYELAKGDVFYATKGTTITFDAEGEVEWLWVTYPADWSGIANE